jgi:hypothetical protein
MRFFHCLTVAALIVSIASALPKYVPRKLATVAGAVAGGISGAAIAPYAAIRGLKDGGSMKEAFKDIINFPVVGAKAGAWVANL